MEKKRLQESLVRYDTDEAALRHELDTLIEEEAQLAREEEACVVDTRIDTASGVSTMNSQTN